jgi:serine/threonine protein kinase
MHTCVRCGADLVADASTEQVCPACLLRLALGPSDDVDAAALSEPTRLVGPVGQGPNGTVYLGYREHGEPRLVTVKLITTRIEVDRFTVLMGDVSNRLRALADSRIPAFLESSVTRGGQAYVLATYIAGCPIARYSTNTLGVGDRLRLAHRLCTLVSLLHDAGIVHGSIKSPNVIVTDSSNGPVPVLLDVGIVPAIEHSCVGPPPSVVRDAGSDVRALEELLPCVLNGVNYAGSRALGLRFTSAAELAKELANL